MNGESLFQKESKVRKLAHIELALAAQTGKSLRDTRFNYEPLFESHPSDDSNILPISFINSTFKMPLWVSSMTGGTGPARHINQNLARAVKEFGLGMGLGSCRPLLDNLDDEDLFNDFNLREIVGDRPLYANLGIAQVEKALLLGNWDRIEKLVDKLKADGLIIHVNPMQEWFQPEGDRLTLSPLESIDRSIAMNSFPIIIKEVGQGMGPRSLEALMKRDLMAIEFAAFGGTNFSKLEQLRKKSKTSSDEKLEEMTYIGHTAKEMVFFVNEILQSNQGDILCKNFIISGGVKNALEGYYLNSVCQGHSVYGQAQPLLVAAKGSYEELRKFILTEREQYAMGEKFLNAMDGGLV